MKKASLIVFGLVSLVLFIAEVDAIAILPFIVAMGLMVYKKDTWVFALSVLMALLNLALPSIPDVLAWALLVFVYFPKKD